VIEKFQENARRAAGLVGNLAAAVATRCCA
jgi:hypothetical protein